MFAPGINFCRQSSAVSTNKVCWIGMMALLGILTHSLTLSAQTVKAENNTSPTTRPAVSDPKNSESATEESIRAVIDQAKVDYKTKNNEIASEFLSVIETRKEIATKRADLALVQSLESLAKAITEEHLSSEGDVKELTVQAARRKYEKLISINKIALVAAYRKAIREHTKNNQIDAAKDVQKELDSLGMCMPSDAVVFGGHWYKAYDTKMTWEAAMQKCQDMGGHLPYVETKVEHEFIWNLSSHVNSWLGAIRRANGEFRWGNGQKLTFTYFTNGQPDNFHGIQNALYIWTGDGKWDDIGSSENYEFVCEWDKSQ